ncbi:terpene cyclase [Salix suchowensis]|nr:terpene cyclase [Salix suchowensis]
MIGDSVSNPVIGQMRMQFWRDAVKGVYGSDSVSGCGITHTRAFDLRILTDHAEATSSTLLYALLSLLTIPSNSLDSLSHAASHVGVAQGIVTLLRGLPYHASKGRMTIPAEITSKHGVSQEEVFRRGKEAKGIVDAVYEFAVLANDHLITARDMLSKLDDGKVPREAVPVFLTGPRTSINEIPPHDMSRFPKRSSSNDSRRLISTLSNRDCRYDLILDLRSLGRHAGQIKERAIARPSTTALLLPPRPSPSSRATCISSPLNQPRIFTAPCRPEAFVGSMDRLCGRLTCDVHGP